ncbi:MAG: helix-turn-helix transcriptional regulator [Clostridia bacterium]|nr:helix-turn-helix transcriptional regulator [Clostridia bacterium]
MNDAQFYNGFVFRKFEYNKYYTSDSTKKGAPRHFFAKLLSGKAKLQCERFTVELSAGDVFYIPYGMLYRSHWYPDSGSVSFYSLGFSHLPSSIDYKMQKIEGAGDLFDSIFTDISVSAESIAGLYLFFARVKDKMIPRCTRAQNVMVIRAVDYMRANPSARAADIANYMGISESGLYGLFKSQLDKSPLDIRLEILTEKATELLVTTDLPIEEISERLGFSSSSYFRKVLFKTTGKTPSAIRKQER